MFDNNSQPEMFRGIIAAEDGLALRAGSDVGEWNGGNKYSQ